MSTLNRNFMTFGGEPITGRTPTQILVYGDTSSLTGDQRNLVEHAYKLFTDSVRLSAAADGYHVQNRMLPDGTRIRMESNSGIDRVMVWPAGGDEEDVAVFYGIPFDESYIDALTGAPGELAKEAVFFVDKMRLGGVASSSILNRLKLADQHSMYPSLVEETKNKPSQPGNTTWFAKGKKRVPVLSWWGQYSRYSNSPIQRSKWGYKVWGRSLLVNNVFWENELTAGLQKYPPIYNADRVYGGDYTIANPGTGSGNANDVRDYVWISGKRVKTGAYGALGLYVLSACIGSGVSGKVVRLTLGITYPTVVAEIGLTTFLLAAKDQRDLVFATEFLAYTITPTLPEALGIPTHSDWINWQLQLPLWNSSGSEAMGMVDHYVLSGVSNVAHSLYKISYDADANVFSASLVEQSSANEAWSNTNNQVTSGTLTVGYNLFPNLGSKTVTTTGVFSSSISAAKVIAADYDGDLPVIVRMEYDETMSKNETLVRAQSGSESQGASLDLYANALCTPHGVNVNWIYKVAPGVWSGTRSFSKNYSLTQRVAQSSRLKVNATTILERSRTYACDVSNAVNLEGTGVGTLSASTIAWPVATTVFHGSTEPATGVDRQMATYTYAYNETHSRNLTFSENSTGSCTDFSIVGDLRTGAFLVHERSIAPGMFSSGTPGDAMTVALTLGEAWYSPREGSVWTALTDSANVSYTDTSSNSDNASIHNYASDHAINGSWSHSAGGGMNYAIPEHDGDVSLVSGSDVILVDTASAKGASSAIERRRSFTAYTPFTASYSETVSTTFAHTDPDIYRGNGSVFGQTSTGYPELFPAVVPTKGTYGYTYDNDQVSNAVLPPPSTNSQPEKVHQYFTGIIGLTSSGPTTTSGGGISNFRFGSDGFGNTNGAGGYPYYTVASSAAAKNGRVSYIGYQSETLIKHDAPQVPYVVKLDLWVVDGRVVVPSKEYPHTGAYKMFSCPVFV